MGLGVRMELPARLATAVTNAPAAVATSDKGLLEKFHEYAIEHDVLGGEVESLIRKLAETGLTRSMWYEHEMRRIVQVRKAALASAAEISAGIATVTNRDVLIAEDARVHAQRLKELQDQEHVLEAKRLAVAAEIQAHLGDLVGCGECGELRAKRHTRCVSCGSAKVV